MVTNKIKKNVKFSLKYLKYINYFLIKSEKYI